MRLVMPVHLIVFTKAPVSGQAKTRLIPALGADGAARLARRMLCETLNAANDAVGVLGNCARVTLCAAPGPHHGAWSGLVLPPGCEQSEQVPGDLGVRMAHAFDHAMVQGDDVLLFGTDAPQLDVHRLVQAAQSLTSHDAVLQPVADGGYVLLGLRSGLRESMAPLFKDMPWSTDAVAALTLRRLSAMGASVRVLPEIHDIDVPDDLVHLPARWKLT